MCVLWAAAWPIHLRVKLYRPKYFWGSDCRVYVLATCSPSPEIPTSFPLPSSQCLWLGKGSAGETRCGSLGTATLWAWGHFGGSQQGQAVFSQPWLAPTCSVLVLFSFPHGHWCSAGVGSRRGARWGGVAQCRLPLAPDCFVRWCNQHSLILFDFFFLGSFCCCYFSCFHHVGSFLPLASPPSPAPPSPVIHQKPETRNHSL